MQTVSVICTEVWIDWSWLIPRHVHQKWSPSSRKCKHSSCCTRSTEQACRTIFSIWPDSIIVNFVCVAKLHLMLFSHAVCWLSSFSAPILWFLHHYGKNLSTEVETWLYHCCITLSHFIWVWRVGCSVFPDNKVQMRKSQLIESIKVGSLTFTDISSIFFLSGWQRNLFVYEPANSQKMSVC